MEWTTKLMPARINTARVWTAVHCPAMRTGMVWLMKRISVPWIQGKQMTWVARIGMETAFQII
jgi:hypothetical protein